MEYSGQSKARPRLRRGPSAPTVPRTRHAIRPVAPSLRLDWIGSGAASGTAAQQHAAGCSMCRPQRDRAQVALGCNTVHVIATHRAALLRHTCVAQRQMSRRGWTLSQCRGGQGIDSVPVQMWVRGGISPGADVGGGGGLGPGADVGGYEPSPVVSDERSPKCTCRRIGMSGTKLRCARTHSRCMRPACRAEERQQCNARLQCRRCV